MALLTVNFPPRSSVDGGTEALLAAWWGTLQTEAHWLTAPIFDRAVRDTLSEVGDYLPTVSTFVGLCRHAKAEIEDEADRAADAANRPLLTSGPVHTVEAPGELDERDPYACTPEERQRWAREDAWLRSYARTLDPVEPMAASPAERAAWQRNGDVASWIHLTPLQRRMKERRIARERAEALAQLGRRFGRDAARLAAALVPAAPLDAPAPDEDGDPFAAIPDPADEGATRRSLRRLGTPAPVADGVAGGGAWPR